MENLAPPMVAKGVTRFCFITLQSLMARNLYNLKKESTVLESKLNKISVLGRRAL